MRTYLKNMYYMTASVFKDFITLFWMLIFPLLLLSFFKLGFGNLLKDNQNLKIKVGISPDNYYSVIYKSIDIFDVSILNENEGITEVENEKISGYVKSDGSLVFFNSNMKSRIIKQVSDQILQISKSGIPMEKFDFKNFPLNTEKTKGNFISMIFYNAIAMFALYGAFHGIAFSEFFIPGKNSPAVRILISPVKKLNLFLFFTVTGFLLTFIISIISILFSEYVLKLNLFRFDFKLLLMLIVGILSSISFGIGISFIFKRVKLEAKIMICILSLNLLAILNGMMSINIKTKIDSLFPLINKLNPIAIIANNFYKITQLNNYSDYFRDISILTGFFIVFLAFSVAKLRGEYL